MRWIHRIRRAIRVPRSMEALERDMDEEMRVHVAMEAEELMRTRGLSPSEARRQALITFGGVERYKEEAREVRGLPAVEELWRDVRHAARRLRREPAFSVPTVASVVLGTGVAVAVFALVNTTLLQPLPYPDPDRLVALTHSTSDATLNGDGMSEGTLLHYREHSEAFGEIGVYHERERSLTDAEGSAEQVRGADVSSGLLTLLGARPHVGRLLMPEDAVVGTRSGVVISYELWVRRYGADPGVVGRDIEVQRVRREVLGVMEPGFGFPHPETHIWYTSWRRESTAEADFDGFYWNGVARLRSGVTLERAEADLAGMVRSLPDAFPGFTAARLEELGLQAHATPLKEHIMGDAAPALRLLLGMGIFLLVITWANAANLCVARAERQRRETAVAHALGARAVHVARRFLLEGLVLAVLGAAGGLALAYAAVTIRFGFDPDGIPRLRELGIDGAVLWLTIALTLATAALLGGVSFFSARRAQIAGVLAGGLGRLTAGRREQIGRRVLVSAQLALALTLLIGASLMAASFWRLSQVELGFEPTSAITFRLPTPPDAYGTNYYHAQVQVHDEILRGLRAIPGVEAAEAANVSGFPLTPIPSYYWRSIAVADRAETAKGLPDALFGFATPGYFDVLGIPILQGRTFRPEDTGRDAHGVVLSRSLARAVFGAEDPIGRRVRWDDPSSDPDYVVVGVVGDVPSETIRDGPSPLLYFPNLHPPAADTITGVVHAFVPSDEMYIIRTDLAQETALPAIREAIAAVDPKLVMTRVGALDGLVRESMARTRLTMLLLVVGAGTALLLGLIGIYGVLSYTVGRRIPELGVRIALGASPIGVVALVVRQGALVALGGIAAGLLAAFALTRFLDSLLYEVSPSEPTAFVAMALLLFLVALAASFVPARRAARIDPTSALKAN